MMSPEVTCYQLEDDVIEEKYEKQENIYGDEINKQN